MLRHEAPGLTVAAVAEAATALLAAEQPGPVTVITRQAVDGWLNRSKIPQWPPLWAVVRVLAEHSAEQRSLSELRTRWQALHRDAARTPRARVRLPPERSGLITHRLASREGAPRFVVGRIPPAAPGFVRRAQLAALRRLLTTRPVVVITGLRGVGKTELAAAQARERLASGAGLVAWVNAETDGTLLEGLAAIARRLEVHDPDGDSERSAHQLRDHLTGRQEPGLLVVDNAASPDRLRQFLPAHSGISVIITTTRHSFTTLGAALDLGVYDRAESVGYLSGATGSPDREGAAALADELGDLPLALTQAAATLTHLDLDYAEYRRMLNRAGATPFLRLDGHEHPLPVHTAILVSIRTAEAETDDAELDAAVCATLDVIAMLSPTGVARDVLPSYEGRREEAIARCVQASLLTRTADRGAVVMHRLVARVLRERADTGERRRHMLDAALSTLETHLFALAQAWARRAEGAMLIAHIDAVIATGFAGPDPGSLSRLAAVRHWAARQLVAATDTGRAITYAAATLADLAAALGEDHPDTLIARGILAYAHRTAGRLDEAIAGHERTLTGRERVLGADHIDTVVARLSLAGAYELAGRLTEALPLYERTLTDAVRVLGPDYPDTLTTRHRLAGACAQAGALSRAIALFEENLAARTRVLGPDHPDAVLAAHGLAGAYLSAGRLAEANALHEATVAAGRRILGPDHPETLTTRSGLAGAYAAAGHHREAIALFEHDLADCLRVLGPEHPATLTTRANLAAALSGAGQHAAALKLFEQIVTERHGLLGPDHPDTLTARGNLAATLTALGRITEAAPRAETHLADTLRVLGPDHPDTMTARANLAAVWAAAGQHEHAAALLEFNLLERDRVLGALHPDTLTAALHVALALHVRGDTGQARILARQVLDARLRILGEEHPDTHSARAVVAALAG